MRMNKHQLFNLIGLICVFIEVPIFIFDYLHLGFMNNIPIRVIDIIIVLYAIIFVYYTFREDKDNIIKHAYIIWILYLIFKIKYLIICL